MDDVLRVACGEIERRIPKAVAAAVTVYGGERRCRASSSNLVREDLDDIARHDGPWAVAMEERRIVSCPDISADLDCAPLHALARRNGLCGAWFVPLVSAHGAPSGFFAVLHRGPRRPTGPERAAVRRIAELAAFAVQREIVAQEGREAGERLRNLMANVPGVVLQWAMAPDGTVTLPFVSDSAEAIAGLRADDIVRQPRLALRRIPPEDRARLLGTLKRTLEALEPATEDFPIECGARGTRWLRLISRPRRREDGTVLSDALCLDITESRMAEQTLQKNRSEFNDKLLELHRTKARMESQSAVLMETARELTEARDAAEHANRAKSDFLSNMSHELRTPLNAIIGFSEIIREQTFGPVGSPKYRDYAADIHESGLHLLELINDVLDFAKIEAGKEQIRTETVDFADAVAGTLRMLHERAERGGVTLDVGPLHVLPAILADRRKIKQILLNLLSNAVKFTGRGGTVTVAAWASDNGFVVQVSDTGIGIALEDIPKALGLFGQIDSPFNRRHEGTGLGLPLTKALVEMHGGSLDLQSQPGVGTTVTVRLPAERIVRAPASAAAQAG